MTKMQTKVAKGIDAATMATTLAPFHAHMELAFPDPFDRKVFLDWLAVNYQNPSTKLAWAPLLISRPGVGKGFLSTVVNVVIGTTQVAGIEPWRLEAKFNSYASASIVCIDEMDFSRPAGVAALVEYISSNYIEVNRKGSHTLLISYGTNFIMLADSVSDGLDRVLAGTDKDSFYPMTLPPLWNNKTVSPNHFDRMFKWIRSPINGKVLREWLANYDVANVGSTLPKRGC